MKAAKDAKERRRTGRKADLSPGDTIHLSGPGRVTIKRTGANGGKVKVVWSGQGKITQGSKS